MDLLGTLCSVLLMKSPGLAGGGTTQWPTASSSSSRARIGLEGAGAGAGADSGAAAADAGVCAASLGAPELSHRRRLSRSKSSSSVMTIRLTEMSMSAMVCRFRVCGLPQFDKSKEACDVPTGDIKVRSPKPKQQWEPDDSR